MFEYKPDASNEALPYDAVGSIGSEFEAFKPNPKYTWVKGKRLRPHVDAWKTLVPKSAPSIGQLPQIIDKMLQATWKYSEPSAGAVRGNIVMGTRGVAPPPSIKNDVFNPQMRPTAKTSGSIPAGPPKATDWNLFHEIQRTNAVTFRGDSRPPRQIIQEANGFSPPNSRTDRFYIENQIYDHFQGYIQRRYQRPLSKADFLRAIDSSAPSDADKKVLVDYMMWRKLCEREAMHLGRMVEQECLKGYISTSRSVDKAAEFGTRHDTVTGWVYVTIVHGGFVVPKGRDTAWGNAEGEIAHWGAIPASRIVGFVRFPPYSGPNSSIYIRRSFRKSEPAAFESVFNILSGKTP